MKDAASPYVYQMSPRAESVPEQPERGWDVYLYRTLLVIAVLSGIALSFYIFVTYRVLFHSDAATKNLLADEIIRTRQFFPSDWYYVNDIWILTPHLILVPLALVFPESFTLQAVACFVFAMLFAGSLYLLYNASGLRNSDFLFAISLLFTGLSPWFAENLFGQFAYGGIIASTFALIALVFFTLRSYNASGRQKLLRWSALLVLFWAIVLASGVRGIFANVVPALVALAIVALAPQTAQSRQIFGRRAVLYVALLILVAAFLGMACFFAIRYGTHFQNDKSTPNFVDYEHLKSNIGIFFEGFLEFSGAMPEANTSPVSLYGVIAAFRLFWFGLALLFPFWLLTRYRSIANPHFRFLIVYYAFHSITTCYLYVFTSLARNVGTFRYCISPCLLAVLSIGYAANELRLRYGEKSIFVLVAACLPIYASSYQQLIEPYFSSTVIPMFGENFQVGSANLSTLHKNPRQPIADYLVRQNLRYGYATYWNAGVVTILSQERTHVSGVLVGNNNPPVIPYRRLSAGHEYVPDAFQGSTFLLLTEQEFGQLNKANLEASLGAPESLQSFGGFRILVYGFNIAARLPGWVEGPDPSVDQPYPSGDLRAELDCKINALTEDTGHAGFLSVSVTDRGGKPFSSHGKFPINLGAHLFIKNTRFENHDYLHSSLPHSLKPGETSGYILPLTSLPPGEYILEVSMVQEGVAWFGTKKNGQPLRINLTVR